DWYFLGWVVLFLDLGIRDRIFQKNFIRVFRNAQNSQKNLQKKGGGNGI
ncbi:hypothetical protein, partial [uncultured Gammaproteobacteria bacterium]